MLRYPDEMNWSALVAWACAPTEQDKFEAWRLANPTVVQETETLIGMMTSRSEDSSRFDIAVNRHLKGRYGCDPRLKAYFATPIGRIEMSLMRWRLAWWRLGLAFYQVRLKRPSVGWEYLRRVGR